MTQQGPSLEALTRRLAECPPLLRGEPRTHRGHTGVHVDALVGDLLMDLGGPLFPASQLDPFTHAKKERRNWLRLVMVAAWLLHDPWFRAHQGSPNVVYELLRRGLDDLAKLVAADLFVTDPDRREELVRRCLAALDLHPQGERAAQAADRLTAIDSVERDRVVKRMRAKMEHAKQVREAMARQAAEEASARYGRE